MNLEPPDETGNPVLVVTLNRGNGTYRVEAEILGDLSDPNHAAIHLGSRKIEQIGGAAPFPGIYKRFSLGSFEPRQSESYSVQPNPGIAAGMMADFRLVSYDRESEGATAWETTATFEIPEDWYPRR